MNRAHAFIVFVLVLMTAGVAACTPPARPPLPTVAILPSDTATLTPSKTFTATNTFTPTRTFTPTATNTFTATATFTSTITLTPSNTTTATPTETPLPSDTPVPTDTPTRTPTRTPTNTFTPSNTPSPTPEPVIRSFTVDPSIASAGTQVVARWDADADKVELDLLVRGNSMLESNPNLPAQGARTFTIQAAQGLGQYTFRLTAFKGKASKIQTIDITVNCPNQWFFAPSPPNACPQPQQTGSFVFQTFQNGVALYVPNNNTVYFLRTGGTLYSLPNDWNTSLIVPTQIPPSGYVDPTGPIGYAWKNRPWPDGNSMQTIMGWATAGPSNYSGTMQVGPSGELYIRGANNVIYRIVVSGTGGSWTTVAG